MRAPTPPTRLAEPPTPAVPAPSSDAAEQCDVCGSADTWWRSCKLLCRGCGSIVKSCADL